METIEKNNQAQSEDNAISDKIESILQNGLSFDSFSNDTKLMLEAFRICLEKKDHDSVLKIAKFISDLRNQSKETYAALLLYLIKTIDEHSESIDPSKIQNLLSIIIKAYAPDEITSEELKIARKYDIPIKCADGLKLEYSRRRRIKQVAHVPDMYLTSNKANGEAFAAMIGVKLPETKANLHFHEIPRISDIVIKPMVGSGSWATYAVRSMDSIISVEKHIELHSWEEMAQDVENQIATGRIQDLFEYQQCIYGDIAAKRPAHDIKFYTFYGEVAAAIEIVRFPVKAWWWWTPDGEYIDDGHVNPEGMKPDKFTPEMLREASRVGSKIPCPFLRIDFLRGEKDLYLGEFTSKTGGTTDTYLENSSPEWNEKFGVMYLNAEVRLMNDLLNGKQFDEIVEFNDKLEQNNKRSLDLQKVSALSQQLKSKLDKYLKLFAQNPEQNTMPEKIENGIHYEALCSSLSEINPTGPIVINLLKRFSESVAENDYDSAEKSIQSIILRKNRQMQIMMARIRAMRNAIWHVPKSEMKQYNDVLKVLFLSHSTNEITSNEYVDIYKFHFPMQQASFLRLQLLRRIRMNQLDSSLQHKIQDIAKIQTEKYLQERNKQSNDDHLQNAENRSTDLKKFTVYSFYGSNALVLEKNETNQDYWWWTSDGTYLSDRHLNRSNSAPQGFSIEMLELAGELSRRVPCPMTKVVFTANDGHINFETLDIDPQFDEPSFISLGNNWDIKLGNQYLQAEMRLIDDLLHGLKFS